MGSSQPRDQTWISCIADGFFTVWTTREAPKVESAQIPLPIYLFHNCGEKKKTRSIKFILLSIFKV